MSRDILITLAIACDNITCGQCRNYEQKRCKVFGKTPRLMGNGKNPERLSECLEAERFAKGDWEARMRAALHGAPERIEPQPAKIDGVTYPNHDRPRG